MRTSNQTAASLLRRSGIAPPEPIPGLTQRPALALRPIQLSDSDEARSLLVQQRIIEPGYRPPELRLRNRFKSKRRRAELSDHSNWKFDEYEVAEALDTLLSSTPLPRSGTVQELLSHASPTSSLDGLYCKLHRKRGKRHPRFLRSKDTPNNTPMTWLDTATCEDRSDYVLLLCQARVAQSTLDRALGIALMGSSIDVIEVLLSYGAVASAFRYQIRERFRQDDVPLARLLLSAPKAMDTDAWRFCIDPGSERYPLGVLIVCVTHRSDISCTELILQALRSHDVLSTAVILAWAQPGEDLSGLCHAACQIVSALEDHAMRLDMLAMLADAGLVTDSLILRNELLRDVKLRHMPLISLLTDAGVNLNYQPDSALYWAVSHLDFEILGILMRGVITSRVSRALEIVPDETSAADILQLLSLLAPRSLSTKDLDPYLVRAVPKGSPNLVSVLISYGASVEHDRAAAIRSALRTVKLEILDVLLQQKCSSDVLLAAIPDAINIMPKRDRLNAVKALLQKGVPHQGLGFALQTLVSEEGDMDVDLIRVLLQYGAPVDGSSIGADSPVVVAARRGNLTVLRMLCKASPRCETLSEAVPIAYGAMAYCDEPVGLAMIRVLLENGASGAYVHQTLLAAVRHDHQLDSVRLLLEYGADANEAMGAPFAVALQNANFEMLQILCAKSAPSHLNLQTLLARAVEPSTFRMEVLDTLLGFTTSPAAALNSFLNTGGFEGNPNTVAILLCFLQHGLDVDIGDGWLFRFAVRDQHVALLRRLLSAKPSQASLSAAFDSTASVRGRSVQLLSMSLLLEQAESAEIGQSTALLREIEASVAGDMEGLKLLLLLVQLLRSKPESLSIHKACLAAASSCVSAKQRDRVLKHLILANGGVVGAAASKLLADSVANFPESPRLSEMLLERGIRPDLATLKRAIEVSPRHLFEILASTMNRPSSNNTRRALFAHARVTAAEPARRAWIYQCLLDADIPNDDLSQALIEHLETGNLGDLSVVKLLLQSGADVGYNRVEALRLAQSGKFVRAFQLMSQYVVDDTVATAAFNLARQLAVDHPGQRLNLYRRLLRPNVGILSIYNALLDSLKDVRQDLPVVQLLLARGADPNDDKARCFVLASTSGAEAKFRALSGRARLNTVLSALFANFSAEHDVARWFKICLEEQPHAGQALQDNLLFRCLRQYPNGTLLLKVLLEHGVSPSAMVTDDINGEPETCTALIWSLFAKPRIGNDAILAIVARGEGALPAYCTPKSKVSAAYGCLRDNTRYPVFKALYDSDSGSILSERTPESSFSGPASSASGGTCDSEQSSVPGGLDLRSAAMQLGNIDVFRLLDAGNSPDDGSLHTAAFYALPEFVEWLVRTHDPDLAIEEFDWLIPLAIVCEAKTPEWCYMANETSDLNTRRAETMQILAAKTDLSWRWKRKTVLHYALDFGAETTKSMIKALRFVQGPAGYEQHVYTGRDAKTYLPHEYVTNILTCSDEEKAILNACLSLHWRR
ncbi:hypothetical protein BAUCODRAFT_573513 [Baudoinia panamericana UAMH 10762]|uniref:Uncharacterized protein n=1 Tax=Baudoinia panamericana (strain UAMH 10762) TaxID=717646 RepID=M2MQW8_BAUPA|nr:uncharacterized protein BAUCODRAFT_573513 [Baudoinia panamericana UAMH 10762]EMC99226.1 hypothetical protein BAUCODRAFT_573513 [Baudoinia panamericana UAMH 10762]